MVVVAVAVRRRHRERDEHPRACAGGRRSPRARQSAGRRWPHPRHLRQMGHGGGLGRRRACHRRDLQANQLRRGPLIDRARRKEQVLAGVEQPRMAGAYPGVRRQTRLQAVPPHEKNVLLRAWECKLDQLIPRAPRRRRAMWVATIWLLVPQPGATGSPMTWDKRSRPPLGGSGAPSGPPFPPDALCGPNRRSTR